MSAFSSPIGLPAKNLHYEGVAMRTARFLVFLSGACLMVALSARAEDKLTPVVAAPLVPSTQAVVGTDGKQHLVYELVITNTGTPPATLQTIEVVGADAPTKVLAKF